MRNCVNDAVCVCMCVCVCLWVSVCVTLGNGGNFIPVRTFCELQPPLNLHIILKGNTMTFANSITKNFKA